MFATLAAEDIPLRQVKGASRPAATSVTSSGNEVTVATTTAPNQSAPIPVCSDNASAQLARPMPAPTTIDQAATNTIQSMNLRLTCE
jgi:hypothetical protein